MALGKLMARFKRGRRSLFFGLSKSNHCGQLLGRGDLLYEIFGMDTGRWGQKQALTLQPRVGDDFRGNCFRIEGHGNMLAGKRVDCVSQVRIVQIIVVPDVNDELNGNVSIIPSTRNIGLPFQRPSREPTRRET